MGAADAASSRALAGLRERDRERRSLPKPPTYRSSSFPPAPKNLEQPLHACIALLDKKLLLDCCCWKLACALRSSGADSY